MQRPTIRVVLRLLIRGLLLLAVVAVFADSDRIAGWLPQSTAFVVVFICTGLALMMWMSSPAERAIYLRAAKRLGHWLHRPS